MANVKQTVPLIWVSDIGKSAEFYCKVLGFSIRQTWEPRGQLTWCWLDLGSASLMLQQHSKDVDFTKSKGIGLYILCENVDPLHERISSNGGEVTPISVAFYGMRQFSAIDPDGNEIWFEHPT